MCLAVIVFRAHPTLPLVIAANRDEFFARATEPADWWPEFPHVLGGRDSATAGSWCAMDRRGRFALLLNPVTPPGSDRRPPVPGRGRLVADWVAGHEQPLVFLDRMRAARTPWRDFKLVIGDLANDMAGITHRGGAFSDPWHVATGVHCTDSGPDDHPWPKRLFLADRARALLMSSHGEEPDWLSLLTRREPVPHSYGSAAYSALRTPFTMGHRLGTRACTVIRVRANGDAHFVELQFGPGGTPLGRRAYSFSLSTTMPVAGEPKMHSTAHE